MTEVWSEKTIRHNGLISFTGFLMNNWGKLEKMEYTTPDLYTYALLNKESGEWEMRVYDIPSEGDENADEVMSDIFADLKEFSVSVAWAKDGKITAVKFYDDGVARPWDPNQQGIAPDFKSFVINMSLKTSKYMSMFSQATYANMDATIIYVAEDDDTFYPHRKGVLYVKVTNLEGDEAYLQDGQFFIRPEVRDEMADLAYERILPHNPRKANRVRKAIKSSFAFNGRLVTGKGTLKGDNLVSFVLNTDVKVDAGNIKPDIATRDIYTGLFQMFPQEQNGDIYTNRQSVASFYDSLLTVPTPGREDSKGLIYDAMADYTDDLINRFRSGEKMLHVDSLGREQEDQLRNNFQKMETWSEAGLSMNESVYLLMVQAGQIVDMHTPEDDVQDKKRRLPVPFASRHSIRNASTYKEVFGVVLDLKFGEAVVVPEYGVFVSDETYKVVAPIWGGADLDDHVELHYRVALDDHDFFGVKAGDIVMVGIRNPIGIVSDGKVLGTEYYVLKAHAVEKVGLYARFGELPGLEMASLPLCSAQVELPNPTWVPAEPAPATTYSKGWLKEQIKLRSIAQGAYGGHVNRYLACRMYDIPFNFIAEEEKVVDLFQQKPYEEGMRFWELDNKSMTKHIAAAGIPMDYWVSKRCGLKGKVPVQRGPVMEIVDFHAAEVDRFEQAAKDHITLVRQAMGARYNGVAITRMKDNKPMLLSRSETMEARYRADTGKTNYLSHWDFEAIGNRIVERLDQMEVDENSAQTRELSNQDFLEAHAWLAINSKPSHKTTSVRSMYYNTDQKLMMGALLDRLIEALLS